MVPEVKSSGKTMDPSGGDVKLGRVGDWRGSSEMPPEPTFELSAIVHSLAWRGSLSNEYKIGTA
jgi:hypothetical protein